MTTLTPPLNETFQKLILPQENGPTSTSIIIMTLSALICICGFLGNFAIVTIILKNKKMQTPTNWFVFNLSISNLAIVVTSIPYNLINPFINWPFGKIGCRFLVMPVMEHFACVCVLTHTAISVARYTILRNFGNRRLITRKLTKCIICLIWVTSFFALSVTLMGILGEFELLHDDGAITCSLRWISNNRRHAYRVLVFIITYIIPMTTTGYSYGRIHYIIWTNINNIDGSLSDDVLLTRRKNARQLEVTLMVMYVCFAVLTIPLHMFMFLFDFSLIPFFDGAKITFDFLLILFYAQILSNPLVLLYMSDQYRKELSHTFRCLRFFLPKMRKVAVIIRGGMKQIHRKSRTFRHSVFEISSDTYSKICPLNLNNSNSKSDFQNCRLDKKIRETEKVEANTNHIKSLSDELFQNEVSKSMADERKDTGSLEKFAKLIKTNLQNGRIRENDYLYYIPDFSDRETIL